MRKQFRHMSLLVVGATGIGGWFWAPLWWAYAAIIPLIALGIYDMYQRKHTIMAIYPLVGRARYWMEVLRPKMYQYFIESDTDGAPISRIFRSVAYQRAKGENDTTPFGTQMDTYASGYEWINHSLSPKSSHIDPADMRVEVGSDLCTHKYSMSLLNISAMSYGSLSRNAVLALNLGAKRGGFAHNTGEGGVSPYHLEPGGDLIWQIGTGYFGARDKNGNFCPEHFKKTAASAQIKMIEIKLSQGAKPGHGGILPAKKNTPEIARIRGVEPYTDALSPPGHSAFFSVHELVDFIARVRELSDGRPVGIKFCVGRKDELLELFRSMVKKKCYPDYIVVDGGEGGTGAAPLEFSNSVGTPAKDGLAFVSQALEELGLSQQIRILASGKVITGFHMAQLMGLGADGINCARGFMLALGCIQALTCNTNHCPSGIATQDPDLYVALDVEDKARRVANFHRATLKALSELAAAAGLGHPSELTPELIYRRVGPGRTMNYREIYWPGSLSGLKAS